MNSIWTNCLQPTLASPRPTHLISRLAHSPSIHKMPSDSPTGPSHLTTTSTCLPLTGVLTHSVYSISTFLLTRLSVQLCAFAFQPPEKQICTCLPALRTIPVYLWILCSLCSDLLPLLLSMQITELFLSARLSAISVPSHDVCAQAPPDTSLSCYSHFHLIIPPTDLSALSLRPLCSCTVSSVYLENRQDRTLHVVRSCIIEMEKTEQTAGASTGSKVFCLLTGSFCVWRTNMRHKFPLRTARH